MKDLIAEICEIVSATFIALGVVFGYLQFQKLVRANEMDLYFRISKSFYSKNIIEFSSALLNNNVVFEEDGDRLLYREGEMENELTLDLLDSIEELCMFYERKIITPELINQGFGTVIQLAHNNAAVQQFIEHFQRRGRCYGGLETLYNILPINEGDNNQAQI